MKNKGIYGFSTFSTVIIIKILKKKEGINNEIKN